MLNLRDWTAFASDILGLPASLDGNTSRRRSVDIVDLRERERATGFERVGNPFRILTSNSCAAETTGRRSWMLRAVSVGLLGASRGECTLGNDFACGVSVLHVIRIRRSSLHKNQSHAFD